MEEAVNHAGSAADKHTTGKRQLDLHEPPPGVLLFGIQEGFHRIDIRERSSLVERRRGFLQIANIQRPVRGVEKAFLVKTCLERFLCVAKDLGSQDCQGVLLGALTCFSKLSGGSITALSHGRLHWTSGPGG